MTKPSAGKVQTLKERQMAPLITPTDLRAKATKDIAAAMNAILADVFALYLKTKNFHWHMSGPHFRDYHLLLDEQADQIYAMSDPIAERIRKVGAIRRSAGSCSGSDAESHPQARILAVAALLFTWSNNHATNRHCDAGVRVSMLRPRLM